MSCRCRRRLRSLAVRLCSSTRCTIRGRTGRSVRTSNSSCLGHPSLVANGLFQFPLTFPKPGMFRVLGDFYPLGGLPQLSSETVIVPGAMKWCFHGPGRIASGCSFKAQASSIRPGLTCRWPRLLKILPIRPDTAALRPDTAALRSAQIMNLLQGCNVHPPGEFNEGQPITHCRGVGGLLQSRCDIRPLRSDPERTSAAGRDIG